MTTGRINQGAISSGRSGDEASAETARAHRNSPNDMSSFLPIIIDKRPRVYRGQSRGTVRHAGRSYVRVTQQRRECVSSSISLTGLLCDAFVSVVVNTAEPKRPALPAHRVFCLPNDPYAAKQQQRHIASLVRVLNENDCREHGVRLLRVRGTLDVSNIPSHPSLDCKRRGKVSFKTIF